MRLEANDRDEVSGLMSEAPDTEITLGTGKMLVLFFGLVVLCSVFFALGFRLGRASNSGPELSSTPSPTSANNAAAKPATKPPDLSFYKSVGHDSPSGQLTAPVNTAKPIEKPADGVAPPTAASTDPTATPASSSSYFVQVAAVSKQEDAEALVDALKKKQYAAFATSPGDKLYHIQVGPFGDIKEAEATRAKLVGDGYNPILKK